MYHRHLEALIPVYIKNAIIAEETNSENVSSALLLRASFFSKMQLATAVNNLKNRETRNK